MLIVAVLIGLWMALAWAAWQFVLVEKMPGMNDKWRIVW